MDSDHEADRAGTEPVTRPAAAVDAIAQVEELLRRISADLTDDSWSPAPADVDDLHDRLETQWRSWREGLSRTAR